MELTAFYTPLEIIDSLAWVLKENNISPTKLLDPSAGVGNFMASFQHQYPNVSVTAFEKDILTGKVLSHLYPNQKVHIEGFERGYSKDEYEIYDFNLKGNCHYLDE